MRHPRQEDAGRDRDAEAGALYPWLGVRLPPEVAALAMVLSSTCVVMSSLSLNAHAYREDEVAAPAPAAYEKLEMAVREDP